MDRRYGEVSAFSEADAKIRLRAELVHRLETGDGGSLP